MNSNSDEQTTLKTTPSKETTEDKILNIWKKVINFKGINEDGQNKLRGKLYRLTIRTSEEIVQKLAENGSDCVPGDLTVDQKTSFYHIVKFIINKNVFNTKLVPIKTCETSMFCCNPFHYKLEELKSPRFSISKAAIQKKGINGKELVEFMQNGLTGNLKNDTITNVENAASEFLYATNFSAKDTVNILKQKTDDCILHSSFSLPPDRVISCFKNLLFYKEYPAKQFEDLITLCSHSFNGEICFNIKHNKISKYVGIFIQPVPVLPKCSEESEKPSTKKFSQTKTKKPSTKQIKKESIERSSEEINTVADKNKDDKSILNDIKKEDCSSDENIDEYKENTDDFKIEENNKEAYYENIKILEEIENGKVAVTEISDNVVNELWEKIRRSYLPNLPAEMRDRENELKDIIFNMLYGGKLVEFLKEKADYSFIGEKAKEYIRKKKPSVQYYTDKRLLAKTQIKPFIAYCFEMPKMVNYVLRYQEELHIEQNTIEEIEVKLNDLSSYLQELFVSQIMDTGFYYENDEEQWAYDMKLTTIVRSAEVFVDYICYLLAQHCDTYIDNFKRNLKQSDFHLNNVPEYRGHLVFHRYRRGMFMRSAMDFVIGKRNISDISFDSEEFMKLKASFVVANITALGVALKYIGIFPKTRVGFSLSGRKVLEVYKTSVDRNRITIARDLWPIMPQDLWIFLNQFEIKTIMDFQYTLFVMLLHETKWHISSVLQKQKSNLVLPTPGIRLRDVNFSTTDQNLTRVTIEDCSNRKQPTITRICNGKKWCLVCLLIELLGHRHAFDLPILDAIKNNSFEIQTSKLDEFLFAQPAYSGRLQVNRCLTIATATNIIDNFAAKLRIPRSYIAFKSFRKAKLIQDSINVVQENNDVITIQKIIEKIRSLNYPYKDSLLNQLIYGNNNFASAFETYNSHHESGKTIVFEDCLKFLCDISIKEDFFTMEHELVTEIFGTFAPLWSSPNKQLSDSAASCRKRMICNELNQFISNFRTVKIDHLPENKLNPINAIDFKTTFSFYTYSFTTENDGIDMLKCSVCAVSASNFKEFKSHVITHKNIQCPYCFKKESDTEKVYATWDQWQMHLNYCHKFAYICRYCNIFISKSRIYSCKLNSHNVVKACQMHIRWKISEAETNELAEGISAIDVNKPDDQSISD